MSFQKDSFLVISSAYSLRLWVLKEFASVSCHPVSPSMGVTVMIMVLPGLGKWFFLWGEDIAITLSISLSVSVIKTMKYVL